MDEKVKAAIGDLVEYLTSDDKEREDFEDHVADGGDPSKHIWTSVQTVAEWLEGAK